ncbi:MAG: hypothetical protein ACRC33_15340, partial [Gemmataceae bacterium]
MHAPRLLAGLLLLAALGDAAAAPAVFPAPPETPAAGPVPVDAIAPGLRDKCRSVLDSPSLNAKAPAESFHSATDVYRWLLDNPQTGIKLWRILKAKVSDIAEPAPGQFQWKDGQGSDVTWQTAYRADGMHVWYAEGKIKPSALLPPSGFRAMAVLRYTVGQDADGKPAIRHQVQFFLRCDGRAMAIAARVLGNSAPRLAEQYLGQLQMFYGGMAWYLCQDTARARQ